MGEPGTPRAITGRSQRDQEVRDAIARLANGPRHGDTRDGRRRKTAGTT